METKTPNQILADKIYEMLMSNPDFGLGEAAQCREDAERLVNEWLEETANNYNAMSRLRAIVALINGEYDNPALMAYGKLSNNREDDILNIATMGLTVDVIGQMEEALGIAESFMAGFEGDEMQDGIDEMLSKVRNAMSGQKFEETARDYAKNVAMYFKAYREYLSDHSLADDSNSITVEALFNYIKSEFGDDEYQLYQIPEIK